jgi:type VI secretion system protein ImpB
MAGITNSQKFIGRNRAPRVQIEYDVESYGSDRSVTLPFVMGVIADLGGARTEPVVPLADRPFLDIDIDHFDERMQARRPRLSIRVPNTLGGGGHLPVEMVFESLDDFSPAAIARQVVPLRKLLDARTQLANLQTYMDGKCGAEALVGRLLRDPSLMRLMRPQRASES